MHKKKKKEWPEEEDRHASDSINPAVLTATLRHPHPHDLQTHYALIAFVCTSSSSTLFNIITARYGIIAYLAISH